MAKVMAEALLAQAYECDKSLLAVKGVKVESAGLSAWAGSPASMQAVAIMAGYELDLQNHQSKMVDENLMANADVVWCMTQGHLRHLLELYPQHAAKCDSLDPAGDVADPFGGDLEVYEMCAMQMEALLRQRLQVLLDDVDDSAS